jgi:hypothetical protein
MPQTPHHEPDAVSVSETASSETVSSETTSFERRRHERTALPAMYCLVEAWPVTAGESAREPGREGHVYDLSIGGARIDLDEPPMPGSELELKLHLPAAGAAVGVRGTVARLFGSEDDPICPRVGVRFVRFDDPADETRLRRFLGEPLDHLAA